MESNIFGPPKIDFEGIDGSGKSSQYELTKAFLAGTNTAFTKEPYMAHPSGPEIYEVLNGTHPSIRLADISLIDFQKMYIANRIIHFRELVLPALSEGVPVISDRGPASMCYGVKSPDDFEALMHVHAVMFGQAGLTFRWANHILIYDVPVPVAMERLAASGKKLDLHETETKLTVARENYLEFARRFPSCRIIDGTPEPDVVFRETKKYLEPLLVKK